MTRCAPDPGRVQGGGEGIDNGPRGRPVGMDPPTFAETHSGKIARYGCKQQQRNEQEPHRLINAQGRGFLRLTPGGRDPVRRIKAAAVADPGMRRNWWGPTSVRGG